MKRRGSVRKTALLQLLPAAVAVATAAHAGPSAPAKPASPPPPPAPPPQPTTPPARPLPTFVDANVLRIRELKLTPSLPRAGETVALTLIVLNESSSALTNVEWKLSGAIDRAGKIASISPRGTQTISQRFTAQAGAIMVKAEVDPRQQIKEPDSLRRNNTATIKSIATPAASSRWATWAQKSADKVPDFLRQFGAATIFEGEINAPTLKVKRLRVGDVDRAALKQMLTGAGVADDVAQAIVDTFAETYGNWAKNYVATVPAAYPHFVAFPGPVAPPMPNVPFPLILGGSPAGNQAIAPSTIENLLRGKLTTARMSEAGASDAIHNFAAAFAGRFAAWLSIQQVTNLMGRGPVPTFAPPYVPAGPVVGGDNLGTPGHLEA